MPLSVLPSLVDHKARRTVGQQVGPDLALGCRQVGAAAAPAILDPNRRSSTLRQLPCDHQGRQDAQRHIASETSTSVTLVGIDGKSQNLLRNQIDELTSTGKSIDAGGPGEGPAACKKWPT